MGDAFDDCQAETDAAAATAITVAHGQPGSYNVVDDDPALIREWLPVLASALDAKPPRRARAVAETDARITLRGR